MAEAESVKTYRRILDQLAAGDQVHPVEEMRGQAMTLIDTLLELDAQAVADDSKGTLGPPLEGFLATALPLIGYGGEPGRRTVVGALQAIASETASREGQRNEAVLTLGLHHLALLILAYALAHDRTDLIPALTSVAFPNRYDGGQDPIFEMSEVRHAAIFGSSADKAYESARDLFMASDLRAKIPYLRRDEDFDAALSEAELLSAMCLAHGRGDDRGTYCHVIGAGGAAERRLRGRVIGDGAGDLALVFGVGPDKLTETLNDLYAHLAAAGPFGGPTGPLIRVAEQEG